MSSASSGLRSQVSEIAVPELDDARFEMLNPIGSGGMGTVYRAVQRSVGRHVAVKMLAAEHAANAAGLGRFVREANAIARIAHPNIVQLIDFGRNKKGQMLLVMELLEGEPLRTMLRRERVFEATRAVFVACECLKALKAAHAAGVIHRDLKPENIFLHQVAGDDHVKVLDFGVAKLTHSDPGENNTTEGTLVGTLRYMPPEQIAGEAPDVRVDVYSMGMVLYEMLSGAMPYDTRDRFVLMRQIIADAPAELSARAPHVNPELAAVVMRAIAKSARDRFDDAEGFRRALLPFLDPVRARMEGFTESPPRHSTPGAGPSGPHAEYSSGVVRSGELKPSMPQAVRSVPPPSMVGAPPSAPPSMVGSPSMATNNERPFASEPVAAPGSRKPVGVGLIAVLALVAVALAVGVGFALRASNQHPPTVPPTVAPRAPEVTERTPAVVVPPQPPRAHLVVVDSRPTGAVVTDLAGNIVCPATPCAVSVPEGEERAVRLRLGESTLNAVLDGTQRTLTLDLPSTAATPPVVAPGPRPTRPRRPPGEDPHGDTDLPMFLPHSGR